MLEIRKMCPRCGQTNQLVCDGPGNVELMTEALNCSKCGLPLGEMGQVVEEFGLVVEEKGQPA